MVAWPWLHSPAGVSRSSGGGCCAALGVLCNHTVLYARLIVGGEDKGVHNFLVQLRNMETHVPLPGVEVGDIGPKWATNNNDNGYLRLTHVRIPRANMLAKFASLSRSGEHSRPGPAKGAYGTMTIVRASIVSGAYASLASAVTIAVRYSAVRRACLPPTAPHAPSPHGARGGSSVTRHSSRWPTARSPRCIQRLRSIETGGSRLRLWWRAEQEPGKTRGQGE